MKIDQLKKIIEHHHGDDLVVIEFNGAQFQVSAYYDDSACGVLLRVGECARTFNAKYSV